MRLFRSAVLPLVFFPVLAIAQPNGGQQGSPCMSEMPMPGCPDSSAQQVGGQQSSDGQPASQEGTPDIRKNPYFNAINYPIAKDTRSPCAKEEEKKHEMPTRSVVPEIRFQEELK